MVTHSRRKQGLASIINHGIAIDELSGQNDEAQQPCHSSLRLTCAPRRAVQHLPLPRNMHDESMLQKINVYKLMCCHD